MLSVDISVLRREYDGALKSKRLSLITLSLEYLQSVGGSCEQQLHQMVTAHFKDLAGKIEEGKKHWKEYQNIVQNISDFKDFARRGREFYQGVPDLKGSNSGQIVEAARRATEDAVTVVENDARDMEQIAGNMKNSTWHNPKQMASDINNLRLFERRDVTLRVSIEGYELLMEKVLAAIIPT
jgi:hypothetical protein